MPAAMAIVVITIGRARLRPASTSASSARRAAADLLDREVDQHDGVLGDDAHQHQDADHHRHADIDLCVMSSAMIAPPIESGSENRMVIGCRKLPNSSTSTPVDHHQAGAHRRGEGGEHLAHDLDVAGLADLDARRQVLRGRQRVDRRDRCAERGVAAQVALDRDAARAVVAVDRGRSVARSRSRRPRTSGVVAPPLGRHAQVLQEAETARAPLAQARPGSGPAGRRR